MNSGARHASFVGLVTTRSATIGSSPQWNECIVRSGSRSPAAPRQSSLPPFLVAYRGSEQGYFQDATHTVLLDGQIDNLRQLASQSIPPEEGRKRADAELVALLFARFDESLFARLAGSFALAIARHDTGEVLLARDRFGLRQCFYAAVPSGWAWASEIKMLCPLLERAALDPEGVRQSIHYRYMTGETLVEGVEQVLPACHVRLAAGRQPAEARYWNLQFRPSPPDAPVEAWADRVDAGLDAWFARLKDRHDDVGILLSGGVDSSLLAAKAARSGFRKCIALTGRWSGDNPELDSAIAVARYLGIEHQVVDIEDSYLEACFPWLVWRLEEPPRHYNSLVLAKLLEVAGSRVGVLLHGHMADTMFGPVSCMTIEHFKRRRAQLRRLPSGVRKPLAAMLPTDGSLRASRLKDCLQLDEHEYVKSFFRIRHAANGERVFGRRFLDSAASIRAVDRFYDAAEATTERFQRYDLYTFLQTQLVVLDRLSAPLNACAELPFLSPEIVEIAVEVPVRLKSDRRGSKPILKSLAARYFPQDWIYRAKQGFPTDTARWLSGPLSRWTRILLEERTAARGLLDVSALRSADVGRDYEAIWTATCLEMFCRQFIDGEGYPDFGRAAP